MKVYEVDKKEFYKGYTLKYLLFFRKRLDLIEKELTAGNLEQALVLTMDEPYINYPEFNFYRINILIRLGHLDLALDVAENKKFENFEPIQIQKLGLQEEIKLRNEQEKKKRREEQTKIIQEQAISNEVRRIKKILITKLYVGVLTLDEIDNADLSDFDKILLKICYYDKYNHANGLRYIKSIKNLITDEQEKKIINNLRSRLENKRNSFFDIAIYKKYICSVDFNYASDLQRKIDEEKQLELERKREEEITKYDAPVIVSETKSIQHESVGVSQTEDLEKIEKNKIQIVREVKKTQKIKTPIIESQKPEKMMVVKSKKNKKNKKSKVTNVQNPIVRIKDVFAYEVEIIGTRVYIEANKMGTRDAIKAHNIFDSIVNQDVNNKAALEKFERLVLKFSRDDTIGVSYNEERFNKYLKREKK